MSRRRKQHIPNGLTCAHCGGPLTDNQTRCCGPRCTSALQRKRGYAAMENEQRQRLREEASEGRRAAREKKKRPPILTDAEQREIDRRVAERHRVTFDSRTLRPGDEGFDEIAAECTPVLSIPDRHWKLPEDNYFGL